MSDLPGLFAAHCDVFSRLREALQAPFKFPLAASFLAPFPFLAFFCSFFALTLSILFVRFRHANHLLPLLNGLTFTPALSAARPKL